MINKHQKNFKNNFIKITFQKINITQVFDQNPQRVYEPRLAEIFQGVIRLSKWARALAIQTEKGNGPHSAPPWR
jgi:hypothetical protein